MKMPSKLTYYFSHGLALILLTGCDQAAFDSAADHMANVIAYESFNLAINSAANAGRRAAYNLFYND